MHVDPYQIYAAAAFCVLTGLVLVLAVKLEGPKVKGPNVIIMPNGEPCEMTDVSDRRCELCHTPGFHVHHLRHLRHEDAA